LTAKQKSPFFAGQRLAAAAFLPFCTRACKHNSIHADGEYQKPKVCILFAEILTLRCIIDISAFVASAAELVHPSFPQLLASETLIREYVCEYTVFLVIILLALFRSMKNKLSVKISANMNLN
jgi:hypothetical protein